MGLRSIPEPTTQDYQVAFSALLITASQYGLEINTNEPLLATFRQVAEVHAQMAAEIRWLRNMIHPTDMSTTGEKWTPTATEIQLPPEK